MTRKEFSDEFARLHTIFGRVQPNEDMSREWYDSLKAAKADELHRVISEIRDGGEEFPASPGVLWVRIKNLKQPHRKLPSCEHCDQGRIHYSRTIGINQKGDPLSYDFYAACDYDSGSVIASRMVYHWQQRGINVRVPQAARYSWLFQRYGGISTAKAGWGLSPDKPPDRDGAGDRPGDPVSVAQDIDGLFDDDGKGESP